MFLLNPIIVVQMLRVNFLDPHPVALIFFAVGPRSAKQLGMKSDSSGSQFRFILHYFVLNHSLLLHYSSADPKLVSLRVTTSLSTPEDPLFLRHRTLLQSFQSFWKLELSITGTVIIIIVEDHKEKKLLAVMGSFRNPFLHFILLGPAPAPVLSPRSQVRYSVLRSYLRSSDLDWLQFYCWELGGARSKRTRGESIADSWMRDLWSGCLRMYICTVVHILYMIMYYTALQLASRDYWLQGSVPGRRISEV
jgi:hypothetical protein